MNLRLGFHEVIVKNRYLCTVLLGIRTAKSVLLKNTTVRNTSSGFYPL